MSLLPHVPSFHKRYRDELRRILTEALQEADAFNTCITCKYFDETSEQCSQFKVRPPARVIAFGCSAYDQDEDK